MDKPITYRDVDQTLRAFGFTASVTPEGYRRYGHPNSPSVLLLPNRPMDQEVSWFHLTEARSALADFGFIKEEEFADVIRNHGRVAS